VRFSSIVAALALLQSEYAYNSICSAHAVFRVVHQPNRYFHQLCLSKRSAPHLRYAPGHTSFQPFGGRVKHNREVRDLDKVFDYLRLVNMQNVKLAPDYICCFLQLLACSYLFSTSSELLLTSCPLLDDPDLRNR
jgi:hypothetical protein